jgi:hypothetical protein
MGKGRVIIVTSAFLAFNLACSGGGDGAKEETVPYEKESDVKADEDIVETAPPAEERGPKRPDELGIVSVGEGAGGIMYAGELRVVESDLPEEITAEIFGGYKTIYAYVRTVYEDDKPGVGELILVTEDAPDSPYSLNVWPESYEVRFVLTEHDELLSSGEVGEGTITERDGYRYVTYNIECKISPVSLITVDMAYDLPDYGKGEISLENLFEP